MGWDGGIFKWVGIGDDFIYCVFGGFDWLAV